MRTDLKTAARKALGQSAITDLQERVASLESEIEELRQQNLRLAEIADVVQELLVPLASRDQDRIDAALETFPQSL
jgi:two-component sensor histidine kinase